MTSETVPWDLPYADRSTRLCDINGVLADFAFAVEGALSGLQTTTDRIVTIPYTSVSNGADTVLDGPNLIGVATDYVPFDTVRADTEDAAVLTYTPSGINSPATGYWMHGFMLSAQSTPQISASSFMLQSVYDIGIYPEEVIREAFPADTCHVSYSEVKHFNLSDTATTLAGYVRVVTPTTPPPVTITARLNSSLYIFWLADD